MVQRNGQKKLKKHRHAFDHQNETNQQQANINKVQLASIKKKKQLPEKEKTQRKTRLNGTKRENAF